MTGRIDIGLAQPTKLNGEVEVGALDLPALLATAFGVPVQSAGAGGPWPTEPFDVGLPLGLTGRLAVKSARLALTPKLAARDARAVLDFNEAEIALREIDGALAGGRAGGDLTFVRRAEGLTARGRIKLTGVDAAELIPGEGALSGRLTLDLTAEGSGRSTVALVGSLGGGGTFKLENGRLARIDPAVFDGLVRAVDLGLPIDAARVRDWMEKALAANGLAITLAEGAITVRDGQARLADTLVHTAAADLAIAGAANLADGSLDARLVLSGPIGMGGLSNTRPEVVIVLKGPIEAPKRTIEVAALSSWLALRAVEQQSQKLEMLEGRTSPANAAPVTTATTPAATAPANAAPVVTPPVVPNVAPAIAPNIAPAEGVTGNDAPAANPASPPAATRAESEALPQRPRPAVRPKAKPAEQARPTAPPPLDLRQFLFGPRS